VRRVLPIFVLLLAGLSACKPADDPRLAFTDSRIPPGLQRRFYPPQGWTWGLIRVGRSPDARYGVAAPAMTPRAQVLILPGYGEPAEAWFETARDLIAHGCTVWILEAAGQGGSGRYALSRDLGHAPSLDPDVAALLAFPARVARDRPLFVLASGESAPVAIRAAELGLQAQGLFLSDPMLQAPGDVAEARRMRRFGLGGLRADGGAGWSREAAASALPGQDPVRRRVPHAWQLANPDLRLGGPSWAWLAAFADESRTAIAEEPKIRLPVMVLGFGGQDARPCGRIPVCTSVALGGRRTPLHLAADALRSLWLHALLVQIDPAQAALAPAPAAATVDDES
jgi:lysophospholipase